MVLAREWKFSQETGLFGIFNMIRSVLCYRDHRSERYLINLWNTWNDGFFGKDSLIQRLLWTERVVCIGWRTSMNHRRCSFVGNPWNWRSLPRAFRTYRFYNRLYLVEDREALGILERTRSSQMYSLMIHLSPWPVCYQSTYPLSITIGVLCSESYSAPRPVWSESSCTRASHHHLAIWGSSLFGEMTGQYCQGS
jgi:hypothetical protein